ncbi:hypothetical protein CHLNCDRAFT_137122 [Chlorella variabilis]|uniref:Uncharacterized protein n=1 Tax=Chlorella variabilis TaxID=554065 RepID=E1ZLA1_CHLVA|nr:hypothetical protein CHLNCDRAFT_137122 [Chlorella variabilis]EFN53366.1 hypothetical protein CHLNCDRAFT_137122 [Chlorella variabilis]|eukprot:XP_005845468.1 hypothetical protein CHLNCDRAFT_137122 [Chlorella variabilis]
MAAVAAAWHPPATAAASGDVGQHYLLAAVAGIDVPSLNVFLQSWRRYSPQTRIVLWVEQNATLAEHGVPADVVRFTRTAQDIKLQRYELWRPFLEGLRRQGKAAGVVLADAGDVLLQADPWQDAVVEMLVAEDALLFSLEGGPHDGMGKPIRDCAANRQCLQRCFGAGAAEQLGGKPIACAGVTIGGLGAVTAYVQQLLDVTQSSATQECRDQAGGHQAVHNFMLHRLGEQGGLRFRHHARAAEELPPLVLDSYGWPFRIDRFGVLRRDNGTTPAIVHQYHRWRGALAIYRAMYPYLGRGFDYNGPNATGNSVLAHMRLCQFCRKQLDAGAATTA